MSSLTQQHTAATLHDPDVETKGGLSSSHRVRVYDAQPFLPAYDRRWANPSPLAFASLASGLYIVSIIALGTDGLTSLSIVPSVALGFSALSLLIAGKRAREFLVQPFKVKGLTWSVFQVFGSSPPATATVRPSTSPL